MADRLDLQVRELFDFRKPAGLWRLDEHSTRSLASCLQKEGYMV
jgi:hypothetical protein